MQDSTILKGLILTVAVLLIAGCDDLFGPDPEVGVEAVTTWNEHATALVLERPPFSNPRGIRTLTYLSIAQYRAVREATAGSGVGRPSVTAAVGRASVDVLIAFYPDDAGSLERSLERDLDSARRRGMGIENITAGEAIGRAAAITVLALAETDGAGSQDPGPPPVGPGFWVSADAPIVRGLYGTRPFFMASGDALLSPPPPAFDSEPFLEAVAEVRSISETRTPEQLESAQSWHATTSPSGPMWFNQLAVDLIRENRIDGREAARVLAFANAAVFDAHVACFHTKFEYWFIRPSQVDPEITTPIGLPNHPSYPAAHACITNAFLTVLADAFPARADEFDTFSAEASIARVIAGIHYRFDVEAGAEIGRAAGELALKGALE